MKPKSSVNNQSATITRIWISFINWLLFRFCPKVGRPQKTWMDGLLHFDEAINELMKFAVLPKRVFSGPT
jgi:hypothetical protein